MLHRLILAALTLALVLPSAALAHDGHKIMGTVTMVAADHLMMKTTDGKEITISITPKTQIVRGKTPVKITDIREGTRVVATVSSHAAPFTASQIDVGKPSPATQK